MWRRSATNEASRRLAVAATTPVKGMKLNPRSCRCRGLGGIADVEPGGVRGRGEHGFHIMGVRFCQRDLYPASAIVLGGHHAELEAGIGGDVSFLRAGKGQNTECERRSGADR